ncbi:MAG: PEP-CTERM sorting domain-containing protein [Verrucomicrobiota bacterium]|nr:PEP-CTERM sorting domain-containing protein [Verrucomicrobiota bacterium]
MNPNIKILRVVVAFFTFGLPAILFAGTFSDNFSTGLNPTFWTVSQTSPGVYTEDHTHGDVRFAKVASTSGLQSIQVALKMSAVGGPITGDFSMQIDFSNAIIGPGVDQVEFHSNFADSSFFFDVYDTSTGGTNVHVWNGSINGAMSVTVTAGTFAIARAGSTLTGYFNGTPIFSETNTSQLTQISFILQNQPSGANDTPSVTFDNFSLTATSVPEPATYAIIGVGAATLAVMRFRRRRN